MELGLYPPPPVNDSGEALISWALDHVSSCAACRAWVYGFPYEVPCEDRDQLSASQRAVVLLSLGDVEAVDEA
jgi:hypothetical protein